MSNLKIAATDRSPEVDFNFDNHRLRLKGESYPEDVATFYGPVFEALNNYLLRLRDGACSFQFELINWCYDEEDDTMRELGEEFGEDLEHAKFRVEKLATDG